MRGAKLADAGRHHTQDFGFLVGRVGVGPPILGRGVGVGWRAVEAPKGRGVGGRRRYHPLPNNRGNGHELLPHFSGARKLSPC